ncbi:hypothetical protein [Candidatus Methanomassiliicoccus intestinalis]|uniref:hypothetical protein n=1 Tax=Candidatus Methanomassiliicoccus intestinalis TaxID=1406512 RepID=UPI00155AFF09|nr:hypothetical protein [Candidatus Methanomassiliicoccus intestinalis]
MSEDAEFKKPKMFAIAGILFALIGVVSFFTCWFIIHDYELKNLSGLDMIPDSSIFAYLPLVIMIISVINIVAFAYWLHAPKNKVGYSASILGMAVIILAIFEHSEIYMTNAYPSTNVGIGFYLAMISGIGIFFCGFLKDADYKRNSIKNSSLIGISAAIIGILIIFTTSLAMNHSLGEDGLQVLHNARVLSGNIEIYFPLLVSLFSILCAIPLITDIFISNRTGLTLSSICGALVVIFTLLELNSFINQPSFRQLRIGFLISLICGILMFLFPIFSKKHDKLCETKQSLESDKSRVIKFVGMLASLVGVVSIVFGWINVTVYTHVDLNYNWTGIDLPTVHFTGLQPYLPIVVAVISLAAFCLFLVQMRSERNKLGYASAILGISIIVISIIFGVWVSDLGMGYVNGNLATTALGAAVYISFISGILMASSGIIAARLKTSGSDHN